jgi:hypothetical protein
MRYIAGKYHLLVFGLFLIIAVLLRLWAAPLSAGPDVAQFWAFASIFKNYGLAFYRYADGILSIFPFKGWCFVYPPVWLLILGLCLVAAPDSLATATMVDPEWRLAMKFPIIAADIAIGCLVFWAVPGRARRLLFSALWLFHPTAWYQSAVFGQFDAIATAFLLASIIILERGKDWPAFLLAGLAVMTKQHTLIPVALMAVALARNISRKRLLIDLSVIAGVALFLSLPFLLSGNLPDYVRFVLLPAQGPDYQYPLMYAFNGIGSLLTYLHDIFGWETRGFLQFNIPALVAACLAAVVLSYLRRINPARAMLIGFCIFIAFFYRINYQYFTVGIPIALLVASRTDYWSERAVALGLALLPAVWLWLFDVPFWFYYLAPYNPWVRPILESIGLAHQNVPDYAYVFLALALTALSLAYVAFAFLRWHRPLAGGRASEINQNRTKPSGLNLAKEPRLIHNDG